MFDLKNQLKKCQVHLKNCGYQGVQGKIEENGKRIISLKKSFSNMEVNFTEKAGLSHLNTSKDPEYVASCERGKRDKLLEKKWNKYNWLEKFILVVVGILFFRIFFFKNYHPVLMEDHWSFYLFKKS